MTTGKWYGLLVVVGIAGGVVAALTLHGEKIGVASATLLALAPMYLAWVAYRREHAGATDLDAVADELAAAVRPQWEKEAAGRQINDSYTLPVAWGSVDDTLMEPWPRLADVARSWPGGAPGDPAEWPADAAGLAGDGAQIGDVFSRRIPTRRLVVLGEPGSGKTVLLIRLLLDLIQRRQSGDPVPVLFSLASWDPVQPLNVWMVERLQSTYPSLRAPASRSRSGPSLAQSLLEAGRIVPLLDGFDELPPALHAVALDTLNRSLPARQAAVLTSRTEPYRAALNGPDVTVRFNSAAVVRLLPLSPELAADYLQRGGGAADAPAMERWRNVAAQLGSGSAVGQSLSTPLGLFLARTSYNRRPQVRTWTAPDPAPHPDRLCDTAVYPTRADLDAHLFNAYIPAAYGWDGAGEPRWNAVEAGQYLGFLARHLEDNRGGSPDLAWWELHEAVPAFIRRLSAGCMGGLAMALGGGFLYGSFDHVLMTWPMCWAMFTLMFSIPATMRPAPLDPLRPWSLRTFGIGLAYAITYGIALAVLVAVTALGRVDTDDIVTMADVELSGLELANYGFLAGLAGGDPVRNHDCGSATDATHSDCFVTTPVTPIVRNRNYSWGLLRFHRRISRIIHICMVALPAAGAPDGRWDCAVHRHPPAPLRTAAARCPARDRPQPGVRDRVRSGIRDPPSRAPTNPQRRYAPVIPLICRRVRHWFRPVPRPLVPAGCPAFGNDHGWLSVRSHQRALRRTRGRAEGKEGRPGIRGRTDSTSRPGPPDLLGVRDRRRHRVRTGMRIHGPVREREPGAIRIRGPGDLPAVDRVRHLRRGPERVQTRGLGKVGHGTDLSGVEAPSPVPLDGVPGGRA
ncbi:NACHT domain-containing protein [Streptomyces atratus]|uniref:NACHT domain-containing protein n=1 Tax=Streptomyces atratus TaxID=1893 RepID=UPI00324E4116